MFSANTNGGPAANNDGSSSVFQELVLWGIAFALAYGQSPLFTSNQNQYFLHGLARANFGQLASDWLANTLDPTPVFSGFVWLVAETLPLGAFYLVYGLLLLLYFISLWFILDGVFDVSSSHLRRHGSALLLLLIHSAALRFGLSRFLGPDANYLIEGGFAGQRLLGSVLQPSSFGVLLLTSIALFLNQRPYAAVFAGVLAATIHPTYLLSAAALTASYLFVMFRDGETNRRIFLLAGWSLLLVLPILLYTLNLFQPSSSGAWNRAADILINERIPHHALPAQWFNWTSILKLSLLLMALDIVRESRLGPLLILPTVLGLLLTSAQLVTGSQRLALLFPWRLSVWLIPISASMVLFWIQKRLLDEVGWLKQIRGPRFLWLVWLTGLMLAGVGLTRTLELARQQQNEPAQILYNQVQQRLEPGQVYLIPPKLQDFRLETGAPVLVDFKSIPYQDRELIEWQERLELAQFFYRDDPAFISCNLLPRIHQIEPITHVVLEQDQFGLDCPRLKSLYTAESFALFRYQP